MRTLSDEVQDFLLRDFPAHPRAVSAYLYETFWDPDEGDILIDDIRLRFMFLVGNLATIAHKLPFQAEPVSTCFFTDCEFTWMYANKTYSIMFMIFLDRRISPPRMMKRAHFGEKVYACFPRDPRSWRASSIHFERPCKLD